jgi:hypothetical protein
MEYFAGLDVSMEETHVSIVDREGKVILDARTPTAPIRLKWGDTDRSAWHGMFRFLLRR